jgi:hypothetical protein
MLEAIISLRRKRAGDAIGSCDTDRKKCGDIIAVKKSPATWGAKEVDGVNFVIRKWEDPALEASMRRDRLVYPYAVFDEVETPKGTERDMVCRSSLRASASQLAGFDKDAVLKPADVTLNAEARW